VYTTLQVALRHRWSGLTRRQTKEVNPAALFSILGTCNQQHHIISSYSELPQAIWQYQSLHGGTLPDNESAASELENIANSLISTADVNKQVLTKAPQDLIE
jgi:ubiquitin-like 1-activating enzyme E1 A